jgi:hypothetical protein
VLPTTSYGMTCPQIFMSKLLVPTKQRITDTVVAAAGFSHEHVVSVTVFVTLFQMTLSNSS